MHKSDVLPIDFAVIGGSVAGLSAAIALSRVGHRVTVFDELPSFIETPFGGGTRIPPNATKILYRWGMEKRLREVSVKSKGLLFAHYGSGSVSGTHEWEEEMLEETGGDFILLHYADIRRLLAETAMQHGVTLRNQAQVVDVRADWQRPYVTLASGEVFTADVVIGADGVYSPHFLCRTVVLKALGQANAVTMMGFRLFHILVPTSALDDRLLSDLRRTGKTLVWYGPQYGALGFPITEPGTSRSLLTIYIYAKYEGTDLSVKTGLTPAELLRVLTPTNCDPRLLALAREAVDIVSMPMMEQPALEEWVHPQGRVLTIGSAAHPIPMGSLYSLGMAVEDAATLGKLFAHLHTNSQISTFLSAVQEIRKARVEHVVRACEGNIFAIALPPGVAEARDRTLRERAERGIAMLSRGMGAHRTSEEMIQAIEGIFAYDPEDEADNWWVKWGLTQERTLRIFDSQPLDLNPPRASPSRAMLPRTTTRPF